jgi:N-acyl-D-amino-acid deacylase
MILIKSGQVIDGGGGAPIQADILIKKNKISAIGNFPNKTADQIIDARGMIVAPGFIDVNTSSDHYLSLFTEPSQKNFLLQGVTTIIGGHCGSSLAPLIYGSLESIRKWSDTNQVSVDWHSLADFLSILEKRKVGVNFGTMVGHSTVRRALIGETSRDLTENELKVMKSVIETALQEGALGVSTGLGYTHSKQTPYPEIKAVAELAAAHGRVYSTHLRDEKEGLLASVTETIKIAEETGVKTLISHFRPLIGAEKDFKLALGLIEAVAAKTDIHFDNYPFPTSIVPIYTLLPRWAQNGNLEVMRSTLETPYMEERLLKELPKLKGDDVTILQAPGVEYLIGNTLGTFSEGQGLSLSKGLLKLMKVTSLRAVVLYKNINLEVVLETLKHPQNLIASNSPGFSEVAHRVKDERPYATFARFLSLVQKNQYLPIEKAIQKLTAVPAKKFSLKGRGEIKEDAIADLVVWGEGGAKDVMVNGVVAVQDGILKDGSAGSILYGGMS